MKALFEIGTREDIAAYLDNLKVLVANLRTKQNKWHHRFSIYNLWVTAGISTMIMLYSADTIVTKEVLRSTLPVLFSSILLNLLKPIIFHFLKRSYLSKKAALNEESKVGLVFLQINHFFPERVYFTHPEQLNLLFQLKKAADLEREVDTFYVCLEQKKHFEPLTFAPTTPYELPFNTKILVVSGKDLYQVKARIGSAEPDRSVLRPEDKNSKLYKAIFEHRGDEETHEPGIFESIR